LIASAQATGSPPVVAPRPVGEVTLWRSATQRTWKLLSKEWCAAALQQQGDAFEGWSAVQTMMRRAYVVVIEMNIIGHHRLLSFAVGRVTQTCDARCRGLLYRLG
jgi:hypothetical protein